MESGLPLNGIQWFMMCQVKDCHLNEPNPGKTRGCNVCIGLPRNLTFFGYVELRIAGHTGNVPHFARFNQTLLNYD